jgi:hypothetical protein
MIYKVHVHVGYNIFIHDVYKNKFATILVDLKRWVWAMGSSLRLPQGK